VTRSWASGRGAPAYTVLMRGAVHCLLSWILIGNALAADIAPPRRGLEYAQALMTASGLRQVVWGDFDGNGSLDAAGTSIDGAVYVYLCRGLGVYEPVSRFEVRYEYWGSIDPKVVAAVDQDGDGVLDLVLRWSSLAWVAFGHGDGTFTPTTWTQLPNGTYRSWCAGDVDGDGRLDFVDTDATYRVVRVYLGAADGTFRDAASLPLPPNFQPSEGRVAVADFDGDGLNDIFARGVSGYLNIGVGACLWNQGGVSFVTQSLSPPMQFPENLRPFDFDGDGAADMVGFASGMVVAFRLANRVPTSVASVLPEFAPGYAAVGRPDLDGDGWPDLVSSLGPALNVVWGREDGKLVDVSRFSLPGEGGVPQLLDVDGDGATDLVASSGSQVLYGRKGVRRFHAAMALTPDLHRSAGVSVTDLDGDARPDLVVDDVTGGRTVILLRDEDGGFRSGPVYAARAGRQGSPIVADLDGDGLADLAVDGSGSGSTAAVLFGDGAGGFGGGRLDLSAGRPVTVARVAGSGAPSLVARSGTEIRLVGISRDRLAEVSFVAECDEDDAVSAVDLAAAGGADLAIATLYHGLTLLRRAPQGWTEFATLPWLGYRELGVAALDVAPGVPRFLVEWSEGGYKVYDPTAGGELVMTDFGQDLGNVHSVQVVDFDGDGLRDLVIIGGYGPPSPVSLFVHRNLGDGTLEPYGRAMGGPSYAPGAVAGDLDGDGWPEVAVVTEAGVEVLRNIEAVPKLRCVAVPAVVDQRTAVRVVVNAEPSNPGIVFVFLDGLLVHRSQGPPMLAVPLPQPLSVGRHEVRVHYADQVYGDSEAALTIEVRPRPPRPRLQRPAQPTAGGNKEPRR
jgi:hypothetical protein